MKHLDYTVRFVPNYGYLPIVTVRIHEGFGGEKELYRGEFKTTAVLAFAAAYGMTDKLMADPELADLLDLRHGINCGDECR